MYGHNYYLTVPFNIIKIYFYFDISIPAIIPTNKKQAAEIFRLSRVGEIISTNRHEF
jgi:hypothetical protein